MGSLCPDSWYLSLLDYFVQMFHRSTLTTSCLYQRRESCVQTRHSVPIFSLLKLGACLHQQMVRFVLNVTVFVFFQTVNQKQNRRCFQNFPHRWFFKTNMMPKVFQKLKERIGRLFVLSLKLFRKLDKSSKLVTFTEQTHSLKTKGFLT